MHRPKPLRLRSLLRSWRLSILVNRMTVESSQVFTCDENDRGSHGKIPVPRAGRPRGEESDVIKLSSSRSHSPYTANQSTSAPMLFVPTMYLMRLRATSEPQRKCDLAACARPRDCFQCSPRSTSQESLQAGVAQVQFSSKQKLLRPRRYRTDICGVRELTKGIDASALGLVLDGHVSSAKADARCAAFRVICKVHKKLLDCT